MAHTASELRIQSLRIRKWMHVVFCVLYVSAAVFCAIKQILVGVILLVVACHEHGTVLNGFLPSSWDHLDCQLWDHPARLVDGSSVCSLNRHVVLSDVEVISGGIQGGQCG